MPPAHAHPPHARAPYGIRTCPDSARPADAFGCADQRSLLVPNFLACFQSLHLTTTRYDAGRSARAEKPGKLGRVPCGVPRSNGRAGAEVRFAQRSRNDGKDWRGWAADAKRSRTQGWRLILEARSASCVVRWRRDMKKPKQQHQQQQRRKRLAVSREGACAERGCEMVDSQ